MLRVLAAVWLVAMAPAGCSRTAPSPPPPAPPPHGLSFAMYHFDAARTGWSDAESTLIPSRVSAGLQRAWATAPLDVATLTYQDASGATQTTTFPARLFASPLYMDDLTTTAGPLAGVSTSVLFAATTNDWLYAIAAVDTATPTGAVVHAGSILWQTRLGTPAYVPSLDSGTPLGVLGTPIVDMSTRPPTLYVASIDAAAGWEVSAVDVTSGAVLPGWPVPIAQATVAAVNNNVTPDAGPSATMSAPIVQSQRAALALAGGTLYVAFGAYYDGGIGWMVAVNVAAKQVVHSFSGARTNPAPTPSDPSNAASGGMWGAGGPAIASDGRLFVTTGNSPGTSTTTPGVWGNSVLAWNPDLTLSATYSPFNYCLMDEGDTDLAGSSPLVFDVDPSLTSTPHLASFGGKQGVVYLVDRDHLGGSLVSRPSCDLNVANDVPSSDLSLYPPTPLPQYNPPSPGPLSVFGPYSDAVGANEVDKAKMRTTPALFRPSSGSIFLYFAGTSRDPANLSNVVPPCLARLRVRLAAGAPAYLETEATNMVTTFGNPGSPIVTSHDGGQDAMIWVLDQNATRTDPVLPKPGFNPAGAILYAFDGTTMANLWQSAPGDLGPSGKYGHAIVAHGVVYVATDRIAAFTPK